MRLYSYQSQCGLLVIAPSQCSAFWWNGCMYALAEFVSGSTSAAFTSASQATTPCCPNIYGQLSGSQFSGTMPAFGAAGQAAVSARVSAGGMVTMQLTDSNLNSCQLTYTVYTGNVLGTSTWYAYTWGLWYWWVWVPILLFVCVLACCVCCSHPRTRPVRGGFVFRQPEPPPAPVQAPPPAARFVNAPAMDAEATAVPVAQAVPVQVVYNPATGKYEQQMTVV